MDRPRERLERLRGEIDLIDDQIVKLLNDRAKIVLKVKEVKSEERWAVHDQEREDALFKRIAAISAGP
ncbi:MAG: chorismate mutase, partial [Terriglobia bacterium]